MSSSTEIQVGDYVIHLTRSDEGLWRVTEMTDRALTLENPQGERRAVNLAFAHHLVRQDPGRFEVQAAFERPALLQLAQDSPADLVTRLARQYGTLTVRDIRERLEPLFASKDSFRKWWAAKTTKAALAAAPRLEFVAPSTYRYLDNPRAVEPAPAAEPASSAPAAEPVDWPELSDIVENDDGATANRIKWRHTTALQRAIRAGRAAGWEQDAVQEFLTAVLLEERLPEGERLRAAMAMHQFGWIQEEEVRAIGLDFWAPPDAMPALPEEPVEARVPVRRPPEPDPTPRRTAAAVASPVPRRAPSPEREPDPDAWLDPTTGLTEMIRASAQLRPDHWRMSMEQMATRLIGLLTSNPAQLAAGGRLDLFSQSLADVSQQCEALSMTPLALHLLAHAGMPIVWKSALLDALHERAPECAAQVHAALRPDPNQTGLYLRSLQRRWEQAGPAALIAEFLARDLAPGHRTGLWNFAMHELSERDDTSDQALVLAILLRRTAPDEASREQAQTCLRSIDRDGTLAEALASPPDESYDGHTDTSGVLVGDGS